MNCFPTQNTEQEKTLSLEISASISSIYNVDICPFGSVLNREDNMCRK